MTPTEHSIYTRAIKGETINQKEAEKLIARGLEITKDGEKYYMTTKQIHFNSNSIIK